MLVEPTGPSRARAVVDSFFEAVVHESVEALSRLLVAGARSRTNSRSGPEPALPFWQKRFDRLDYLAARGEVLYRPRLVEVHTSDSAAALPDRVLAVAPKEGQVIVRVPLAGARSGLFGPEIALVLEPQRGGGYRIQEIVEDFRLP